MKLIIQIPCLNEADTLHRVITDLPTELPGVDCIETLVIDDGSTDGTAATALGLGVHHVVRHRRNRGLAAAFSTGLDCALALGADIIVNTDGDHQYPGRYVAALVQPIVDGRADLVIGDRRPEQDRRNSLFKRWLYWVGRHTISRMLGQTLPDPVSGFRSYSREAASCVHVVTRFSYTLETLVQSTEAGLAIESIPLIANPPTRPSRLFRSHLQFVTRSATTVLRVFFMIHPLQSLMWVSGALGLLGLLPILRFIVFYLIDEGQGHLQSLVLGASLVVLAVLVLLAGLIGDLIAQNRRLLNKAEICRLRMMSAKDISDITSRQF